MGRGGLLLSGGCLLKLGSGTKQQSGGERLEGEDLWDIHEMKSEVRGRKVVEHVLLQTW